MDDVDDSVRDMWKAIQTDPNIPPLLTMPGIQSPTELVLIHCCLFRSFFLMQMT